MIRLKSMDRSILIDNGPSRRVDNPAPRLHQRQLSRINQVLRMFIERRMQGNTVRHLEETIQRVISHASHTDIDVGAYFFDFKVEMKLSRSVSVACTTLVL
jgi:transcriptional regulator with AAA-type ATPase domain